MSVLSLSYWESDVYWRQNNKDFADRAHKMAENSWYEEITSLSPYVHVNACNTFQPVSCSIQSQCQQPYPVDSCHSLCTVDEMLHVLLLLSMWLFHRHTASSKWQHRPLLSSSPMTVSPALQSTTQLFNDVHTVSTVTKCYDITATIFSYVLLSAQSQCISHIETSWTLYRSQCSTDLHQTCHHASVPGDVITYCFW